MIQKEKVDRVIVLPFLFFVFLVIRNEINFNSLDGIPLKVVWGFFFFF